MMQSVLQNDATLHFFMFAAGAPDSLSCFQSRAHPIAS